jgi:tripartite-type tricarboxylate transporter receptor subunit TctC
MQSLGSRNFKKQRLKSVITMKNMHKILGMILAILISNLSLLSMAYAAYPEKPIRLIVPFPPGGSTDIFSRMLGEKLTQIWKQPVIIENKAGASGQIAVSDFLKAPADGYTVFIGHIGTLAVNPSLFKNLSYDPNKDFAPISRIATVPNVFVINPSQPFKNIQELITYAQNNPGKLTYSSGGSGGAAHIAMEYFKSVTRTDILHIPYKGTAPAVMDLLGGQVSMTMTGAPPLMQHIIAKKVVPLGVSSLKRIDVLPQIPTLAESGVPELKGFDATQWYGVVVKAGTPKEIIDKLNQGTRMAFDTMEAKERLRNEGAIVQVDTPEEFRAFIKAETLRWGKVVRAANITPN